MQERFEIDQERMFTAGNDVVGVEIGRVEDVEESQVRSLSLVEPPHFLLVLAFFRRDELRPPICATIEDGHRTKRRLDAALVQPT